MKRFFQTHRREIIAVVALFVLFLALRVPGISLPYHQDEYKTAISVELGSDAAGSMSAHPPLMQIIYRLSYFVFGGTHLRWYPIVFSSASFFLMYALVRRRGGILAARIAVTLFTVCFLSVWSSLSVDTDGAILPFFFLLALYAYDSWERARGKKKKLWGALLAASLVVGFLVKLSFILVIGAIMLDSAWQYRHMLTKKVVLRASAAAAFAGALFVVLLLVIHKVYPAFRIDSMIEHAKSFAHVSGRNYVQIIVQMVKTVFYLSPLMVLLPFIMNKTVFEKARVHFWYLGLSFIFYFILFDFSRGALDKYMMLTVVPLCIINAFVLAPLFERYSSWRVLVQENRIALFVAGMFSLVFIFINFIPHVLLPLYPKTAWFSGVVHLHWRFLNPFMGGSGPLGFYVSFLLIGWSFIIGTCGIALAFLSANRRVKIGSVLVLIILSGVYNAVFIEELIYGKINGNSEKVTRAVLRYIAAKPGIKKVITYNDIGSYELNHMGKAAGRFYATPEMEETHRAIFEKHNGYFLVVNIPHFNDDSFYGTYFAQCTTVFESTSGAIVGRVYNCARK